MNLKKSQLMDLLNDVQGELTQYTNARSGVRASISSQENKVMLVFVSIFAGCLPLLFATGIWRNTELTEAKKEFVTNTQEKLNQCRVLISASREAGYADSEVSPAKAKAFTDDIATIVEGLRGENAHAHVTHKKSHRTFQESRKQQYNGWESFWRKSIFQSLLSNVCETCLGFVERFQTAVLPRIAEVPGSDPR